MSPYVKELVEDKQEELQIQKKKVKIKRNNMKIWEIFHTGDVFIPIFQVFQFWKTPPLPQLLKNSKIEHNQ